MPATASPEALNVPYDEMGVDVHRAVGRILNAWADSSFRVDHIEPEQLEGIRTVLRKAEGSRLPDYRFDENGKYTQMGTTPVVEERHARVEMRNYDHGSESLWLRVPRFSMEPAREASNAQQNFTKRDIAIFGAGGLAVNGLLLIGLSANRPGLAMAGVITDIPLIAYGMRRTGQVLGALPIRSERHAH